MNTLAPYTSILEKWDRRAGPRPSVRELKAVHLAGLARIGSKNAMALAMALRPAGATQAQISAVLGGPHRNKLREVISSRKAIPVKVSGAGRLKVYKLRVS